MSQYPKLLYSTYVSSVIHRHAFPLTLKVEAERDSAESFFEHLKFI